MEILMILFLSTLMCFIINSVFRFNRTVFILLSSVLVFLFVSFFIIFLGFEFLGLVFATVYVGGIVVMFLFLILIVDVRTENTQKLIFKSKEFLFTLFFSILFTLFFSIFFIYNYCPILANTPTYFNFFHDAQICLSKPTIMEDAPYYAMDIVDLNSDADFVVEKLRKFYTKEYVLELFFGNDSFDEIYILGVTFLKQHGLLLCLAGLFLLIATVVAVILCLNIFN